MQHRLEFFDDPARFLSEVEPLLAARPVTSTVVASVSGRLARDPASDPASDPAVGEAPPRWWVVLRDEAGVVVGAGMRTAPSAPYAPYLLAMPESAARLLARTLHDRGESLTAVNGAAPTVEVFAAETAALAGGTVHESERMGLYELEALDVPPAPAGRLRVARAEDLDLVLAWFDAFGGDASAQAGRPDPHPAPIESRVSTVARIEAGDIWLWEDQDATVVSLTAFNPISFGVARVGPVYTPREHRGRGYAGAGVAEISRRLLDEGARVCLFADQANRTSSALYRRLGYRVVGEQANLVIA